MHLQIRLAHTVSAHAFSMSGQSSQAPGRVLQQTQASMHLPRYVGYPTFMWGRSGTPAGRTGRKIKAHTHVDTGHPTTQEQMPVAHYQSPPAAIAAVQQWSGVLMLIKACQVGAPMISNRLRPKLSRPPKSTNGTSPIIPHAHILPNCRRIEPMPGRGQEQLQR